MVLLERTNKKKIICTENFSLSAPTHRTGKLQLGEQDELEQGKRRSRDLGGGAEGRVRGAEINVIKYHFFPICLIKPYSSLEMNRFVFNHET